MAVDMTDLIQELKHGLQEHQLSTNPTILDHHSRDESYHQPAEPEVVVFPETTEEVQAVVKAADAFGIQSFRLVWGQALRVTLFHMSGG